MSSITRCPFGSDMPRLDLVVRLEKSCRKFPNFASKGCGSTVPGVEVRNFLKTGTHRSPSGNSKLGWHQLECQPRSEYKVPFVVRNYVQDLRRV